MVGGIAGVVTPLVVIKVNACQGFGSAGIGTVEGPPGIAGDHQGKGVGRRPRPEFGHPDDHFKAHLAIHDIGGNGNGRGQVRAWGGDRRGFQFQDRHGIMCRTGVAPPPGESMLTEIPGIPDIDQVPRGIIPVTGHGMAFHMDHHRPAGIDLCLVLLKGKSPRQVVVAADILAETAYDLIAA